MEQFLRHLQYHTVNEKICSQFISNSNWSKHNFSVTQVVRRSSTFLENISKEIKSRYTYIAQFTYPHIPMLYFYHQILRQFSNISILVNVGLIKLYFLKLYKILFIIIFLFQKSENVLRGIFSTNSLMILDSYRYESVPIWHKRYNQLSF